MEKKLQELIFLKGRNKFIVEPAQIVRLESLSNYTRVYFTDHQPVLMAKVLRLYDHLLCPYGFARPHRSHLVNLQHVDSLDEMGFVRMRDDSKVETSRRKRRQFICNLQTHISTHPISQIPSL